MPKLSFINQRPDTHLVETEPASLRLNAGQWYNFRTRPDLTESDRRIWILLRNMQQTTRYVYPGLQFIAQHCHLSTRTVQRSLRRLEQANLLTTKERFKPSNPHVHTSNLYIPHWNWFETQESSKSPVKMSPPVTTSCRHPLTEKTGESESGQAFEHSGSETCYKEKGLHQVKLPDPETLLNCIASDPQTIIELFQTLYKTKKNTLENLLSKHAAPQVARYLAWLLLAPEGVIHSPLAWLRRALKEQWTEPSSWVKNIQKTIAEREHKEKINQEIREKQETEAKESARIQAFKAQRENLITRAKEWLAQQSEQFILIKQIEEVLHQTHGKFAGLIKKHSALWWDAALVTLEKYGWCPLQE